MTAIEQYAKKQENQKIRDAGSLELQHIIDITEAFLNFTKQLQNILQILGDIDGEEQKDQQNGVLSLLNEFVTKLDNNSMSEQRNKENSKEEMNSNSINSTIKTRTQMEVSNSPMKLAAKCSCSDFIQTLKETKSLEDEKHFAALSDKTSTTTQSSYCCEYCTNYPQHFLGKNRPKKEGRCRVKSQKTGKHISQIIRSLSAQITSSKNWQN